MADSDDVLPAGDAAGEALRTVFASDYERLVRAARVLVDHREDAEEVVQEALARCYARWVRTGVPPEPLAYVRGAVLNRARTRLRRRIRGRALPRDMAAAPPSPEDVSVAAAEQREAVARLQRLPRRQRECLVLRYFFDASVAEAAIALEISEGSVKTHTHRALRAIEAQMGDD